MNNTVNQKQEKSIVTINESPELKVCHKSAKGSPKGSIIFVPGVCHGAWCFENFMEFFSDNGYDCFALNLREHGDNFKKGTKFATLSQYKDDVAKCVDYCLRFLKENGINEKPFLLGHSMGGAVVQKYIKKYYNSIKGAILFAPATAKRMPYFNTLFGLTKNNLSISAKKAFGLEISDEEIAQSAFFDNRIKSQEDIKRYNSLLHRESFTITFISLYVPYYIGKFKGDIPILVTGSYADSYFPEKSLRKTGKVYGCSENDTRRQLKILPDLCHDMMLDPEWEKAAKVVLNFMENNK